MILFKQTGYHVDFHLFQSVMFYLSLLIFYLCIRFQYVNFSYPTNFVEDLADSSNLLPPNNRKLERKKVKISHKVVSRVYLVRSRCISIKSSQREGNKHDVIFSFILLSHVCLNSQQCTGRPSDRCRHCFTSSNLSFHIQARTAVFFSAQLCVFSSGRGILLQIPHMHLLHF